MAVLRTCGTGSLLLPLWSELPSSGSEGSVGLTYIEHRSFLSTLTQSKGKPGIPQRSSLGGRGISKFCRDLETPR